MIDLSIPNKRRIEGIFFIILFPILAISLHTLTELQLVAIILLIPSIISGSFGFCRILECANCKRTDCSKSPNYGHKIEGMEDPTKDVCFDGDEKFNPSMR